MGDVRVKIEGLDGLMRRLNELARTEFWTRARFAGGEVVRKFIAVYPGPPRYPIQWKTERQRRWFLNAARRGEIEVPYRRQFSATSQRLGPSWTVAKEGEEVFVGTRATYAPFVQSHEHQQPFHRNTGWVTDKEAAERAAESGDLTAAVRRLLDEIMR